MDQIREILGEELFAQVQQRLGERTLLLEGEERADIQRLQEELEREREKHRQEKELMEAMIQRERLEQKAEMILTRAGARNIRAAKALMNLENLQGDEEAELLRQAAELKEKEGYLFEERGLRGFTPAQSAEEREPNPFEEEQWNLKKQEELFRKDPEKARRLLWMKRG